MTFWAKYLPNGEPYALLSISAQSVDLWTGEGWIGAPPILALEVTGIGGDDGWELVLEPDDADGIRNSMARNQMFSTQRKRLSTHEEVRSKPAD